MLCVNNYEQGYVTQCRAAMQAQLAAYAALKKAGAGNKAFATALAAFESQFFNNLVIVLDGYFMHRSRTIEGKDGNPLNELRIICASLLENGGVLAADKAGNKSIKYNPEKAVVKLKNGDTIALDEASFTALFTSFFAEIEAKFV